MAPKSKLRALREARRMNQTALGRVIGVHQATISKYEDGRLPLTEEHRDALAAFFGCAPQDLAETPREAAIREAIETLRGLPPEEFEAAIARLFSSRREGS